MGKSKKAVERRVEPLVRRAMSPVVGDRYEMPDGCGRRVVYVTDDGLVGWRETWETGESPTYFDALSKWHAIVKSWLGDGVTFVGANNRI